MADMPRRYLGALLDRLARVMETQAEAIEAAAGACARSILADGLAFAFGTGHGAFAALEMYPRTGTVTGFRPIVESTMISFHRVLGDGGARQYRFIHAQEGYGRAILSAHHVEARDTMILFSHSGINAVTLDVALGAREAGLTVVAVTSLPHSSQVPSRHSCGKRLFELADVVVDTGVPLGDAGIEVGVFGRTGATSTPIAIAVGQAINAATAERIVAAGRDPFLMVSPNTVEKVEANARNDRNYAELWRRLRSRG